MIPESQLLGRTDELARLMQIVDGARRGVSSAAVLVGDPGTGKSSLLREGVLQAARTEPPLLQLRARGAESEAEFAFAGLLELVHPLTHLMPRLPEPQVDALKGALALSEAVSTDRFSVCAATLGLLELAAAESPVLAVVDDLHWLDPPSIQAILFAARRLGHEGIVMLLSTRPDPSVSGLLDGIDRIDVRPLAVDAASALVRTHASRPVVDAEIEALMEGTGGNPLALVDAAAQLTPGTPRVERLESIPIAERIRSGVARRLAPMSDDQGRAVLLAAATGTRADAALLDRALRAEGLSVDVLDAAERAGLLTVGSTHVEFDHPLTRSSVYALASSADRRAAHRALAGGAADGSAERAWHLAAAAFGMDEEAAAALEQVGRDALARGAPSTAMRAFDRSAGLTDGGEKKVRRLLHAGNAARLAGSVDHARDMLSLALEQSTDPLLRADALGLLFQIETWRAPVATARTIAVEADQLGKLDRARAARMLAEAAAALARSGNIAQGVEFAEHAHREMAELGIDDDTVELSLLFAHVMDARGPEARDGLLALGDRVVAQAPTAQSLAILHQVAWIETWIEEYEPASRLLERAVDVGRREAPGTLPMALATRAELQYRQGRLLMALADAEESAVLAADFAQHHAQGLALTCQSRIEACLGNEESTRRSAGQAHEIGRSLGGDDSPISAWGSPALGLLALSKDDPEAAIPHLEKLVESFRRGGIREPGVVLAAGDLIEAYLRTGRDDVARELLESFGGLARQTERLGAQAIAARCEGMLAPDDRFEACFAQALALHARVVMPFERARTERSLGHRRLRAGDVEGGRQALRAALAAFADLGAGRWAQGVAQTLEAAGESAHPQTPGGMTGLSPQELRVAHALMAGSTSEAVGQQLLLSRGTVEEHQRRIYDKLGVGSIGQLADRFQAPPHPPGRLTVRGDREVVVEIDGRALGDGELGSPRSRLLLVALLAAGGPVERDELGSWVWPELGRHDRVEAVDNAVSTLRATLGDGRFPSDGSTVSARLLAGDEWNLRRVVEMNVTDVETQTLEELEAMIDDAGRPVMPQWRDAPWYEHLERRRSGVVRQLRGRHARLQLERGEVALAEREFEQLNRQEPLVEDWHRGLMRCFAARGDTARALRQYHLCRSALRQEHGVDPEPATQALYLELLEEQA